MKFLFALAAALVSLLPGQGPTGRITRSGVARAQAVVDSVFLDRKATEGSIEGGDWASYLMARLGVEPIPENTEIQIVVDNSASCSRAASRIYLKKPAR
jgi:hypothetical protein